MSRVETPIEIVDESCRHCDSEQSTPLWAGSEHEYDNTTDEVFEFVRCAQCDVVRLNPRPDVSELGRIYPPQYYAYNLMEENRSDNPGLLDKIKARMYQRRLSAVLRRLGKPTGPIRLLDIGCGDGRLLDWYKASSDGPRLQTFGVEMSEAAATEARRRGHEVVSGRFEIESVLEHASFDLILASHVIEHVDEPLQFARHAAELLAPGGIFVIYTPNWDSPDARFFKGLWGGNHFPRHWTLYTPDTLAGLAQRIGLELSHVEYQPNPIFWVWSCHATLKKRFPNSSWPDRLFPTVQIFHRSVRSFLLLSVFTALDLVMRGLRGRTASIAVDLRKAAP